MKRSKIFPFFFIIQVVLFFVLLLFMRLYLYNLFCLFNANELPYFFTTVITMTHFDSIMESVCGLTNPCMYFLILGLTLLSLEYAAYHMIIKSTSGSRPSLHPVKRMGLIMRAIMRTLFSCILLCCIWMICIELILMLYYKAKLGFNSETPFVMVEEYKSPYVYKRKPNSVTNTDTGNPLRFKDMTEIDAGGLITSLNNYSMRRQQDSTEIPEAKTIRILSYGDSIGFGVFVNDDEHYPAQMETMLNADNNSPTYYEVLNMARGYCPSVYAMHIKRDITQFKPHKVIIEIELSNDLGDEALCHYSDRDAYGLPNEIVSGRYWIGWRFNMATPLSLQGNFWERSKLGMLLGRNYGFLRSFISPNPIFSPDTKDAYYCYHFKYQEHLLQRDRLQFAFDRMFSVLAGINTLCNDNGIDFYLLILPSQFMFYENNYNEPSTRIVKDAEDKAQDNAIMYASLTNAYRAAGGKDIFIDFCHPIAKGYEAIAHEATAMILAHDAASKIQ